MRGNDGGVGGNGGGGYLWLSGRFTRYILPRLEAEPEELTLPSESSLTTVFIGDSETINQ